MFDLQTIIELFRVEPGHNLIECMILSMIWWTCHGVRKDLSGLRDKTEKTFQTLGEQVNNHEGRIVFLEKQGR